MVKEANERGTSLTALIREIVSTFTRERTPKRSLGFSSLIGVADGDATDIARSEEDYRKAAEEDRLRMKLGDTSGEK